MNVRASFSVAIDMANKTDCSHELETYHADPLGIKFHYHLRDESCYSLSAPLHPENGLLIGGILPSLNAIVRHLVPKDIQATAFGFNSSATFFGSTVAAVYGFRTVCFVTMTILLIVCEGYIPRPLGRKKGMCPETNTLPKQHTPPDRRSALAAGLLIDAAMIFRNRALLRISALPGKENPAESFRKCIILEKLQQGY